MTELTYAFGPMVASQLLYTLLFLVGAAVGIPAMEQFKRIRPRYGLAKLGLLYAWPSPPKTLPPKPRTPRSHR